eukprot:UN03204
MGIPFPRIKDYCLFLGDHWKSYLLTLEKGFRFPNDEFTISIFFQCSQTHLMDLHKPLTIFSKGPLRKTLSAWVQRSKQNKIVYCCVNCPGVYENSLVKVPLDSHGSAAHNDWHHCVIKLRKRNMSLTLDKQPPKKIKLDVSNKKNKFKTTGHPMFIGSTCLVFKTSDKKITTDG